MGKNKKSNKNKEKKKSSGQGQPKKQKKQDKKGPVPVCQPKSSFQVRVNMDSDWHIGSGAGRQGDVDRSILRDRDGFPYIPAKTLTGIWRDACELVAWGLDDGADNGIWQQWVNYLFGEQPAHPDVQLERTPNPATLSIRAARFLQDFRDAVNARPFLKEFLTFNKPGIQIDSNTGSTKEDHLRLEEMARAKAVLQTDDCWLDLKKLDEQQQKTAWVLLLAGAQMVDRLGAKRRRGSGKCSLKIVSVSNEELQACFHWLQQQKQPPELPTSVNQTYPDRWHHLTAKEDDTWEVVELTITTETPITIASRTVGNIVESLDYIRGAYLLPIVTRKLGNFGKAIARADVLVTNATIATFNSTGVSRGKPMPLAIFYEKESGNWQTGQGIYNRLVEKEPSNGVQLKGMRSGYIGTTHDDQLPAYIKTDEIVSGLTTHNTIKDDVQRPDAEVGGVYSYQTIAANLTFKAELRLKKTLADDLSHKNRHWWKQINGKYGLGQSKKDDYGLVTIQCQPPHAIKNDGNRDRYSQNSLTVWLLSDVLLRDEHLRPTTDPEAFRKALQNQLNRELPESEKIQLKFRESEELLNAIARSRRMESWQVRWGLPRPSLVGIMAGSCFVFDLESNQPKAEKLNELEISGIGERTAEGYGQVCFNDPLLTERFPKQSANGYSNENNQRISSSSQNKIPSNDPLMGDYASIVEKEAWRDAIRRVSLHLAQDKDCREEILGIYISENEQRSIPSLSQLGSLRSVLTKVGTRKDSVLCWIDNVKEKKKGENTTYLERLKKLVICPQAVWQFLESKLNDVEIPSFTNLILTDKTTNTLQNELWEEAIQTLVETLIRAHKRALEGYQKQTNSQENVSK
jgi:CRISPR-associated protein Csx10